MTDTEIKEAMELKEATFKPQIDKRSEKLAQEF
jgi:hypothetical protein